MRPPVRSHHSRARRHRCRRSGRQSNRRSGAGPTIQQFLGPASPTEVGRRPRWIVLPGCRTRGENARLHAAPPSFAPVRLTAFLNDDGFDLTDGECCRLTDRPSSSSGSDANSQGWHSESAGDPTGLTSDLGRRTASPASLGAWRGHDPRLRPMVRPCCFVRAVRFIARALRHRLRSRPSPGRRCRSSARWHEHGPSWSPDGRKIAFVTNRCDHSFVVVYDVATRT